jgi:3D (Asp-Asp-Asp) domain-containing protein
MTRFSSRHIRKRRIVIVIALVCVVALSWICCSPSPAKVKKRKASVSSAPRDPSLVLVTGYCNCEKCCGWKKSWFGFGKPVYDYGPNKGKPKKVGVTASGIEASAGTVAADPKVFKFGTRLEIPGYGIGRVEDVGGAIKGRHIDLWFPSHKEALKWGRRWLKVVPVAGGKGR